MSAPIVPAENDDDCDAPTFTSEKETALKGIASIVDSIELPEKNEESEQVETEIPTDNIQKYLPLIRAITGRQLGHSSFVSSVSFSPDGRRIVSGSGDKTIDPSAVLHSTYWNQ